MKTARAGEIAQLLSDNEKWHSHGRGINMQTLREDLKLRIDDFSRDPEQAGAIKEYFELLRDYMIRQGMVSFVHTREYF
jgi:hypothetical protein